MDARDLSGINSSDHSGMMVTPNSYGGGSGLRGPSMIMANSSPMMPPGMRFPFSTMASSSPKLLDVSGSNYSGDGVIGMKPGGTFSMNEPAKKKRGRPRKYGPDESMSLALCSTTSTSEHNNNNSSLTDAMAKKRGRPRGSGKKQQLDALGSSGTSFTPHVITVKAGEDVASKIMAFSQQGPRTVCILSANGAICNVTLRQPSTSCGTVTYEGRFEIISLSGSFLLTENDGSRSRTCSLSVELAASDGHVLGGVVAGILMAATPVQVVVGSFLAERKKPKPEDSFPLEPSSVPPPQMSGFAPPLASSPQSQASSSDSDEDQRSPMNHHGSSSQQFLPPYATGWSNAGN